MRFVRPVVAHNPGVEAILMANLEEPRDKLKGNVSTKTSSPGV